MMVTLNGYSKDYVTLRCAERQNWFANLVWLGFLFMNPSLGGNEHGERASARNVNQRFYPRRYSSDLLASDSEVSLPVFPVGHVNHRRNR